MIRQKLFIFLFPILATGMFMMNSAFQNKGNADKIKWLTWEQAQEANKKAPKKIFIDVYTDWCGWCKRMDASTFQDDGVANYINKNFYAVKLDAEQKADIQFGDKTFKFLAQGARGVHEFAYALLDGKLGYPAYVFLNEKNERIMISPGYKEAPALMKELEFSFGEHYKTKSFEDYTKGK
jgi:uncharacterized protein YyaL (SSP411 family)